MGPNVKKLIAMKIVRVAIPAKGTFADGLKFLTDPEKIKQTAKQATEFVKAAIQDVRNAGEPNSWKNADDETIAAEILRKIDEKK